MADSLFSAPSLQQQKSPAGDSGSQKRHRSGSGRSTTSSSSKSNSSSPSRKRAMPWFGIDIGGTLVKLVYFEPTDSLPEEMEAVASVDKDASSVTKIHRYLVGQTAYGESGIRDQELQIEEMCLNGRIGTLHFIRFPTNRMSAFINMVKSKGFAETTSTVCATGGGAIKFEGMFNEMFNVQLFTYDELLSVVKGVQLITSRCSNEVYYWDKPLDDENCVMKHYPDQEDDAFISRRNINQSFKEENIPTVLTFPYLLVNVGSGVSIIAVDNSDSFRRVGGSSIGGGTFHGLCSLLTGCESFDDALKLATDGDNSNVDKLVRDIYGGDYDLFNLSGSTVAASFGNMIYANKRAEASKQDLARAALVTITNNIGSIVRLYARSENIERVVFVGNFLRVNPISQRMLAYAMNYWSQGKIEALFLKHEGYFGAVGCLSELMKSSEKRRYNKHKAANLPIRTQLNCDIVPI